MSSRLWQRLVVLWSLTMFYVSPVSAETWNSLLASIRKRFPDVPQLATADLAKWLAATNKPAPLLIDARAREEFAVSHLQNAHQAETVAAVETLATTNSQPIVVYCSVGFRSSALVEKLRRAGFSQVYNLEGSIFRWANEGRSVFRGTIETNVVHPYDAKWGKLLDRRFQRAP